MTRPSPSTVTDEGLVEALKLVDRIKQLRVERNRYGGEGDGVDTLLIDIQDYFDRAALSRPLDERKAS